MAVAGVGTADAGPSTASKPIEEIEVGDFVWARDEHDPSAPAKLEKVVALYRSTAYDLQQFEVVDDLGQSEQIVATDGHTFYVVDVGWTTADAIQVGQKLVGAGGAVLTVVANQDWKPDGGVVVYNFQVEGDHTYFVGDIHAQGEWVWTHNACNPLALNMAAAKIIRPPESAAHHIVAQSAALAAPARAVLKKFSISVDSIDNGVYLPRFLSSPNPTKASVHSTIHTIDYYTFVNTALTRSRTRGDALAALDTIRQLLLAGHL